MKTAGLQASNADYWKEKILWDIHRTKVYCLSIQVEHMYIVMLW